MMLHSTPDRIRLHFLAERKLLLLLIWLFGWGAVGCNFPASTAQTPGLDVTQAYQTVEARLTQALALTPAMTSLPTSTVAPQETPLPATEAPSPQPIEPTATKATPTPLCDLAAPGVPIDVTVPDDTQMQPEESFTKIWRLQNVGTCTWTTDYDLVWFSGEKLSAPDSVPFSQNISPGQMVELAVDMVAPSEKGTYQSNWKLRNSADELFGIGPGGNAAFWVRIVVVESSTATITATVSATETPTPTPTTQVQASGSASLSPDDAIDLDTNQVNSGISDDLLFLFDGEKHSLDPIGTAAVAVFGSTQPDITACRTITLSADPLIVEDNLPVGTYLCYRTNLALPGWALVTGFDAQTSTLDLQILTWTIP